MKSGGVCVKAFTETISYEEAVFLVKQQVVYLEKMIKALKQKGEVFSLAFMRSAEWACQKNVDTFSSALCSRIDWLRFGMEEEFAQTAVSGSRMEARFFDLDVLSLLFVHASEMEAVAFCEKMKQDYKYSYCGTPVYQNIGPALYEQAYRAFSPDRKKESRRIGIQVGLSYQQNYLVEVVSRDRGEAKEDLLTEAADQVIAKYHRVVDYE